MAVAERKLSSPVTSEEPRPYRWTRERFHEVGDAGLFEGQSVILIEGEILTMPPIGPFHQGANSLAADAVRRAFGDGFFVREQAPFNVGASTDPQPDIAVVQGGIRDYIAAHPAEAALIVEISVSTLAYDRGDKASLYASAGVADYWIVNPVGGQVEVFRQPAPDPQAAFGTSYAEVTSYRPGETITPIKKPEARVVVIDLLP